MKGLQLTLFSNRGQGLYFQRWKYFKPFCQHHTHMQILFLFSNIGCHWKTLEMYKWVPLNPIQSYRGELYYQKWKYFQLFCQNHIHRQTLFLFSSIGCHGKTMGMYKWAPLNPIQSQRGGFIFRNGNTSCLSTRTTPVGKLWL